MKRLMSALLIAAAALAAPAPAAEPPADEAVFVEGARYDAVLRRHENAWRLLPADGADLKLQVAADCRVGLPPPRGLWLLTRDAEGRPALVAPSATPLPAGHPGRIRLVGCGEAVAPGEPALAVPARLARWLGEHSGAIYVAD